MNDTSTKKAAKQDVRETSPRFVECVTGNSGFWPPLTENTKRKKKNSQLLTEFPFLLNNLKLIESRKSDMFIYNISIYPVAHLPPLGGLCLPGAATSLTRPCLVIRNTTQYRDWQH